ncbi:hypothetical protein VB264_01760 [Arcicella aquatica]|uniref:Uncharacterized protein n=1 Tax=Arcicella aquatica TaxID=217141 RepID=A0ABU5QHI4_9BACT|nr:hypothetical protein [Arcicella aquatica]MEA5256488.1 hypothetical protein [Arcicella aquatica]
MIQRFLKKIALLSFLIIISLYALAFVVDSGLRKSRNAYYASWNDLFDGKINADLLILGSSRAEFHISPKIIDSSLRLNSYNLGMSAWHFDMQFARFKLYLAHNKKPKYIIHNVDVYGFAKRADVVNPEQFLPFINEPVITETTRGHKGEFDEYQQNIPLLKYKNQQALAWEGICNFVNFTSLYDTTTKYKGYRGNTYEWNHDFERFKKRYPKGVRYTFDKTIKKQFEEYLAFCEKQHIKVVLLYAPEYYEVQPLYKNKHTMIKMCKEASERYHCYFLDYSKDSLCYQRKYFYNSQHLNKYGAEIFSQKLALDVKKLLHI